MTYAEKLMGAASQPQARGCQSTNVEPTSHGYHMSSEQMNMWDPIEDQQQISTMSSSMAPGMAQGMPQGVLPTTNEEEEEYRPVVTPEMRKTHPLDWNFLQGIRHLVVPKPPTTPGLASMGPNMGTNISNMGPQMVSSMSQNMGPGMGRESVKGPQYYESSPSYYGDRQFCEHQELIDSRSMEQQHRPHRNRPNPGHSGHNGHNPHNGQNPHNSHNNHSGHRGRGGAWQQQQPVKMG